MPTFDQLLVWRATLKDIKIFYHVKHSKISFLGSHCAMFRKGYDLKVELSLFKTASEVTTSTVHCVSTNDDRIYRDFECMDAQRLFWKFPIVLSKPCQIVIC